MLQRQLPALWVDGQLRVALRAIGDSGPCRDRKLFELRHVGISILATNGRPSEWSRGSPQRTARSFLFLLAWREPEEHSERSERAPERLAAWRGSAMLWTLSIHEQLPTD